MEAVVSAFAATLRAELVYLAEGSNAKQFASNFAHDVNVHIPKVHWETTTSRVLTIDRVYGLRIDDPQVAALPVVDRDRLATLAAKAAAKMIFEDGFFHADPHPGNLFVESTHRNGLIDFAMVGEIDDQFRKRLGKLLFALSRNDPDRICCALRDLSVNHAVTDNGQLRQDVTRFMQLY